MIKKCVYLCSQGENIKYDYFAWRGLFVHKYGDVRNVLLFSICLFVYSSISSYTERVIEANSLLLSFYNECVDLQRRRERSGKLSWYVRKLRSFFPACSFICAKARGVVLWEIENARAKFTCQLQYCTSRWIPMETKPTEHLFQCSKNMYPWRQLTWKMC